MNGAARITRASRREVGALDPAQISTQVPCKVAKWPLGLCKCAQEGSSCCLTEFIRGKEKEQKQQHAPGHCIKGSVSSNSCPLYEEELVTRVFMVPTIFHLQ